MNKIIYPAAQWINTSSNKQLCLLVPSDKRDLTHYMLKGFKERGVKYLHAVLSKPKKPWTTGFRSQNTHVFGHGTELAGFVGQSVRSFLYESCERAISKRYPTHINDFGKIVPNELSENDTVSAAILIEQLHEDAAFLEFTLTEYEEE